MNPTNNCAAGLERRGEANYGMAEQRDSSRRSGPVHISVALGRLRNRIARAIATRDAVFSHDISRINDKLQAEIESLREQLASRSA